MTPEIVRTILEDTAADHNRHLAGRCIQDPHKALEFLLLSRIHRAIARGDLDSPRDSQGQARPVDVMDVRVSYGEDGLTLGFTYYVHTAKKFAHITMPYGTAA